MKSVNDIAVIVQARTNSQRIPNKMLRPFANTNLFELVLSKLLKSKVILEVMNQLTMTIVFKKYMSGMINYLLNMS